MGVIIMNDDFIESLIDNYVEQGYAERVDENSMKALEDDVVIYLEPVFDGEDEMGVEIFSNDVSLGVLDRDDENFVVKFNDMMMSELNI